MNSFFLFFWFSDQETWEKFSNSQTTSFSDHLDHFDHQFSLDRSQNFEVLVFWSIKFSNSQTTSFSEQVCWKSCQILPNSQTTSFSGKFWQIEEILTWDGRWGVETRSDVLIHRDSKVKILNDLSIALIDAEFDPVNEWFSCNRYKDVADPLLWSLSQLLSLSQVSVFCLSKTYRDSHRSWHTCAEDCWYWRGLWERSGVRTWVTWRSKSFAETRRLCLQRVIHAPPQHGAYKSMLHCGTLWLQK